MAIDQHPTTIVRVYKGTSSRVKGCYSELNCHASYLIVCDRQARVTIWHGSKSGIFDKGLAEDLGFNMAMEVPGGKGKLYLVLEGKEKVDRRRCKSFQALLSSLWLTEEEYFSDRLKVMRETAVHNHPKTMHIIVKVGQGYGLKKVGVVGVESDGSVKKLSFAAVESPLMMVVLESEHQWDLWIGSQVTRAEVTNAQAVLKTLSASTNIASEHALDSVLFGEKIRLTKQGCERAVFRNNFSDGWKMGHMITKSDLAENELDQERVCNVGYIGCGHGLFDGIFSIFKTGDSTQEETASPVIFGGLHPVTKLIPDDFTVYSLTSDVLGLQQMQLKSDLVAQPQSLIGWQIQVEPYGIAVVTGMEIQGVPTYCLKLSPDSGDCWVPLKLQGGTAAQAEAEGSTNLASVGAGSHYYTPLRKVAMPEIQPVPID